MKTHKEILAERDELNRRLDALDEEENALLEQADDTRLAAELHRLQCRWNHTDGCAWFYEESDSFPVETWRAASHTRWLKKARGVMAELPDMTVDTIIEVANALR